MNVTKPYSILFNAMTDAYRLLENGNFDQAQALLKKAQQESEELFINSEDNKNQQDKLQIRNLALELGITKEYTHELLVYNVLNHDILDTDVRDDILDGELMAYIKKTRDGYENKTQQEIRDEFEDDDFYQALYNVFNRSSHFYLQLGLDMGEVMTNPLLSSFILELLREKLLTDSK